MFHHLRLENFAMFKKLHWKQHQRINILTGENDCGKTYLLKILYCLARSIEEYKRILTLESETEIRKEIEQLGEIIIKELIESESQITSETNSLTLINKKIKNIKNELETKKEIKELLFRKELTLRELTRDNITATSWKDILTQKLLWIFQPRDWLLGQLITQGENKLKVNTQLGSELIDLTLIDTLPNKIADLNPLTGQFSEINTLYIPAQEILTAFDAINATREHLEIAGFDDTYFDLIKALRLPVTRGEIQVELKAIAQSIDEQLKGQILFESQSFVFRKAREQYTMPQTAESIKKIGIFSTLINNRKLKAGSILFIDQPETHLHPHSIIILVDTLFKMAQAGLQIYLATHNEWVLKRFQRLAQHYHEPIGLSVLSRQTACSDIIAEFYDLRHYIPSEFTITGTLTPDQIAL
ncbi:MAG: AAA family ATPase [Pseudomonadota bacterium]|nr:AAA family ATPase [Pseudomonadota bacterium]